MDINFFWSLIDIVYLKSSFCKELPWNWNIDYTSIIYGGESEAQTQQTQKMQNLTEKNENGAQKNARFYFSAQFLED